MNHGVLASPTSFLSGSQEVGQNLHKLFTQMDDNFVATIRGLMNLKLKPKDFQANLVC